MSRNALAGALPTGAPRARGPALAAHARRHQLVGARRLVGTHAPLRAEPGVRERQPGEGDAARGVPARHREPRPGCRRARLARADDHGLVERRGRHRLLPRRRRGPLPARPPGRHAATSPWPATGAMRTSARRTRRASSAGSTGSCRRPRAGTRAGSCPRSWATSAGASRATRPPPASRRSSRAAGAGPAPGSSCTRRRCSSAAARASRWRCSPTGTRHMTTGPRRCGGSRSGSSGGLVRRRSLRRTTHRRRAGRPPPAGRDWWTSTASRRASA